jgi:tetratricopeptide (TPR) repeat protein
MRRAALPIVVASVLAACQTPPPAEAPHASPQPAAQPEPVIAPPVAPPAPLGPVGAAAQQQAQKIALASVEMLESGNEESASAELKRALAIDPQNKLALNMTRQIAADPATALGRESFAYTVRQSDTMSRIAQRFLGDVYAFYILARYNNIAVPKQVSAGQVLRIPGKAPPPGAAAQAPSPAPQPVQATAPSPPAAPPEPRPAAAAPPPPPPPPPPPEPTPGERAMRNAAAAERTGDLARARTEYQNAATLGQPGAAAKADQLRTQLAQRYANAAKGAFSRQDLDASIANWQRVLEVDPDYPQARSELERMRGLKEKLGKVK